ncbi:MAG: hypothetical protein JWP76_4212 [Dactylosporangium sp.]|jgi:hypothetical protein|nr:hypothetical protein [Dactylosporangium sp.]
MPLNKILPQKPQPKPRKADKHEAKKPHPVARPQR